MEALRIALLAVALVAVTACGGGSTPPPVEPSGPLLVQEVEPNDLSTTASGLPAMGAGAGNLDAAGDTDYWSFQATAGQFISVEIFAVRCEQQAWADVPNLPVLTLLDQDGTTILTRHEYNANLSNGWTDVADTREDLDIACFQIPATGTYFLCVEQDDPASEGARYGLRVNTLDLGVVQLEVEAVGVMGDNESAATAETLVPGHLKGWHVDDDVDMYKFVIAGPTIVYFELKASRNGAHDGDDYYDPELYLYDTDGVTELNGNDDAFYYDSAISHMFTTAGTYYLSVDECCGDGDAPYYLEFRSDAVTTVAEVEPNDAAGGAQAIAFGDVISASKAGGDEDWYSFSAQAGDAIWAWLFDGDNLQGANEGLELEFLAPDGTTVLPADAEQGDFDVWMTIVQQTGTYYVRCTTSTNTSYCLRLERFGNAVPEVEPNDVRATAGTFDANGRAMGVIGTASDADVYSFTAVKDEVVLFSVISNRVISTQQFAEMGSDADTRIEIHDDTGMWLADAQTDYPPADDIEAHGILGGMYTVELCFMPPADGTYYVTITEEEGYFDPLTHYYWVQKH